MSHYLVLNRKTNKLKEYRSDGNVVFDLGTFTNLEMAVEYIKKTYANLYEYGIVFLPKKKKEEHVERPTREMPEMPVK